MLRTRLSPRRVWSLVAVGLWLVFSCAVQPGAPGGSQGWWDEHGPVVPHDLFPGDCSLCHVGDGWRSIRDDLRFDHAQETGVALEGAHARAECLRCHNDRGPVALFAARGCAGCHQDPHRGQLGPDCSVCHDQETWRPREVFAEHARTRFPLIGAHAAAACWRCHPGAQVGNFARTDTECLACHSSDLARAVNPDHVAMGWTDCQRCHVPTGWGGGDFVHAFFPLTGQHAVLDCDRCHAGGVFAGTPTRCSDCHLADYQATRMPNHAQLGIPMECERCHGTSTWSGAVFPHTGITTNCVDCHLADYQATTMPDHAQLGISMECERCHGTSTWSGAVFSHAGITTNCVDCHLADYQATRSPDHAASGFGTVCEACHTSTTTWFSATFDHDRFPIDRGAHRGLSCADCHLTPGNYASFSCTHCHAHNQGDMNRRHDEVSSYVWQSSACYACHPDGRGDD